MKRAHPLGLMLWRGGVLLAAVVAGYEVARISRPAHCNAMDLGEYAVTYVLIRTGQDWRITAVLSHDPERAPWTS
jgi:hypothetical protein